TFTRSMSLNPTQDGDERSRTPDAATRVPRRLTRFRKSTYLLLSFTQMDSSSAMSNASFSELGIPGYSFADLHEPERLASLHDRFCEEAAAADPALWREWDASQRAPAEPGPR